MYGKKVKLRALFILLVFITLVLSIFLILKSLEEEVVYFISPSEIKNLQEISDNKVRVGGLVKKGSILKEKHLVMKKPGFGFKENQIRDIVGRKLLKNGGK